MTGDRKRVLLPAGATFKVTANIVIEGELTAEELRELFVHAEPETVTVAKPEPSPDDAARKAENAAKLDRLMAVYREHLDEPPTAVTSAFLSWLTEFGEQTVRDAILETSRAPGLTDRHQRYEYLREVLRLWRRKGRGAR